MSNKDVYTYTNGGYQVSIDGTNGTKHRIRIGEEATTFPESLDLKITGYCDAACAWCHESSTKLGKHADLSRMLRNLNGLPSGVEVAIGGGNPLSYPDLDDLLKELNGMGLLPSLTVNSIHLGRSLEGERNIIRVNDLMGSGLVYGLGVSMPAGDGMVQPYRNMYLHLTRKLYYVDRLVLHCIAGIHDLNTILGGSWGLKDSKTPPTTPTPSLLVLGYKSWGRGKKYSFAVPLEAFRTNVKHLLLRYGAFYSGVSFDTLALTQLDIRRYFVESAWNQYYMGGEGEFSMYYDGVENQYAESSYAEKRVEAALPVVEWWGQRYAPNQGIPREHDFERTTVRP